ncbi:MAG: DUF3788 family protein [Vicinamibacterales bacterium]
MDAPVLTDRNQFPGDDVIFPHLGRRRALWEALFGFLEARHPDCVAEWRYYNDGKSWLLNVSRKKKTVFWLSLVGKTFRITAYFTDKARDAIRASALPDQLKEQFLGQAPTGRLRGITITFRTKRDVEAAKVLVALKKT